MKSLDEESRVFAWGRVYRWAAIIGAILGGSWAGYYVFPWWGTNPLTADGWLPVGFMRCILAAIVLLAVPAGAMCGAALVALLHFWIWCFVKVNEVWTRK